MSRHKIAFLFPGQGAQYVGMGRGLYDAFSSVRSLFAEADAILDYDLSRLILEGPSDALTLTKHSQPAIYLIGCAVYRTFASLYPNAVPYACAGLSLGEYTALTAAGRISFEEGLRLVAERARLMQEACEERKGSMRVVLGLDEATVASALEPIRDQATIANVNCPGQVVIAGTEEGLDSALERLKSVGAKRVLPLDVSGAFHSFLMRSAKEGLTPFLLETQIHETNIRIVMNTPGDFVEGSDRIRENLIAQVTETVRWQKGIEALVAAGVTHFIESGPGKTLGGMNKRIGLAAPTYSLETPDDLEGLSKSEEFLHVVS